MKTVIANKKEHSALLKQAIQYFSYDFSFFLNLRFKKNGRFDDILDLNEFWDNPEDHWIYLFYDDENKGWKGQLIGYAFVTQETSKFSGREVFYLNAFWCYPPYRGLGWAEDMADSVFEHHEGRWELFVMNQNKRAKRFWTRVTKDRDSYKRWRYKKQPTDSDHSWDGWVYSFITKEEN